MTEFHRSSGLTAVQAGKGAFRSIERFSTAVRVIVVVEYELNFRTIRPTPQRHGTRAMMGFEAYRPHTAQARLENELL